MRERLFAVFMLIAATAGAKELVLVGGGDRVVDRDPATAVSNCQGWVFAPSPVVDDDGSVNAMYTASDALTNRCKSGIDPAEKFGDRIRFHARKEDGTWSGGVDVIDRSNFAWMQDSDFLAAHPEAFVGHLASPSVIKGDGRYYMAFVGSVDDRNLCAGEHFAANICGSCFDPWSYFVVMWAVSDDGLNWRVRQRGRGDATLIGRAPDSSDRYASSIYKGFTRVALIAREERGKSYFYFGTQYWTRGGIKMAMFRIARDRVNEWGIAGDPELWIANRGEWVSCRNGVVPDFLSQPGVTSMQGLDSALSSIVEVNGQYIAFTSYGVRYSQVAYYTSANLVDWKFGSVVPSVIRYVADGNSYEVSVIDPIAVADGAGGMLLFFASADGDERNGIDRDGRHDCFLDPRAGPTAPYMGTGIYEAILDYIDRRAKTRAVKK